MTKHKSKLSPLIMLFTALTALIMLISGLTFLNRNSEQSFADDSFYTSEGLAYEYIEAENGYSVSRGHVGSAQFIEVPATYDDGEHGELPITSVNYQGFYMTYATVIRLPLSCTIIKEQAFKELELPSINSDIPGVYDLSHVTEIYKNAFYNNVGIQKCILPENTTLIRERVFFQVVQI
jgi:hypothetical protein